MGWISILKKTGKFITYPIRHPANALREGGSAIKTGAIGTTVGYITWQALINDKPVMRTVSNMAIGSDNVDKVTGAVGTVVDGVTNVTTKAGEALGGVSEAMNGVSQAAERQSGAMSGMGNFMQSLMSGNGLNMVGDFFKSIGEGKVSGMSFAGLIGSAFLLFGRFGWFGKIAGALLGMMILGNNIDIGRVMGNGNQAMNGTLSPTDGESLAPAHRRR